MNILTKISVVVLLVLVLFASGVFISASVIPDNWRIAATNQQLKTEQAKVEAMNSLLVARNLQIQLDQLSKQLVTLKSDTAAKIADLTTELGKRESRITELTAQTGAYNDQLLGLQKNLTKAQNMYDDAIKLIASLRTQADQASKENIALGKQVMDYEAKTGRYENLHRADQVTIQDLTEQVKQLTEQKGKPVAGKSTEPEAAPGEVPKVDGQVTAVKGDVASINIGSAKGIKPDMKLIVYRETKSGVQILGHMRVTDVDLTEASGIISDRQDGDVRQSDHVTTSVK